MYQVIVQVLCVGDVDFEVGIVMLDQFEYGLIEECLVGCDVLVWWGYKVYDQVDDVIVVCVQKCVFEGMGLIVLYLGYFLKIFCCMMGMNCLLKWCEVDEKECVWVVEFLYLIVVGLGEYFELLYEEMYGECFDILQFDSMVFIFWFEGGEVFCLGCIWECGYGCIFYFCFGYEVYLIYYDVNVQKVLNNVVCWVVLWVNIVDVCFNVQLLELIVKKVLNFVKVGILQSVKDI